MPEAPGMRRIDLDAEAARLAEERKRATEAAAIACRFCGETAQRRLMWTSAGWRCLDGTACDDRQAGVPGE